MKNVLALQKLTSSTNSMGSQNHGRSAASKKCHGGGGNSGLSLLLCFA